MPSFGLVLLSCELLANPAAVADVLVLNMHKPPSCDLFRKEVTGQNSSYSPVLVVLVVFVFPWGLEHPGVFLPGGLLTQGCFQVA